MGVLEQVFSVKYKYSVFFTEHVFHKDNPVFRNVFENKRADGPAKALFVIDSGVKDNFPDLEEVISSYTSFHKEIVKNVCPPIIITGGEKCKNDFAHVEQVLRAINDNGICRHSYVVGIGGGALLDLVGFASTIAHRGIRHIRIPTTVLSQNDSGIGVKNSVNAFGKKNFLGCFAPPHAVINDFTFLDTLEERDWRAGLAEAVKVAVIKDGVFYEQLRTDSQKLRCRDKESMHQSIIRCADLHMQHIRSGDPFESGSARPLDFGHWSAHKLEQLSNYAIRHGEAVAIGIALDSIYARLVGLLHENDCRDIMDLIKQLGFRLFAEELLIKDSSGVPAILHGLDEFREHLGGKLSVTLPERIGKAIEVNTIDLRKMEEAITLLQKQDHLRPPASVSL